MRPVIVRLRSAERLRVADFGVGSSDPFVLVTAHEPDAEAALRAGSPLLGDAAAGADEMRLSIESSRLSFTDGSAGPRLSRDGSARLSFADSSAGGSRASSPDIFMPTEAAEHAAAAAERFAHADSAASERASTSPSAAVATARSRTVRRSLDPEFDEELLLPGVSSCTTLAFTIVDNDQAAEARATCAWRRGAPRLPRPGAAALLAGRARRAAARGERGRAAAPEARGTHACTLALGSQRVFRVREDRAEPQLCSRRCATST